MAVWRCKERRDYETSCGDRNGAVTPIGIGVDTFWENVKKKTLGFGEITRFDTTDYKVHIAAEVKDFAGKDYMDFKAAKRMELFCQYAGCSKRGV